MILITTTMNNERNIMDHILNPDRRQYLKVAENESEEKAMNVVMDIFDNQARYLGMTWGKSIRELL